MRVQAMVLSFLTKYFDAMIKKVKFPTISPCFCTIFYVSKICPCDIYMHAALPLIPKQVRDNSCT